MSNIVIGKRTTIGAAITSTAGVFSHFFPEHGAAFIGAAVPITFMVQVWVANAFGVTNS